MKKGKKKSNKTKNEEETKKIKTKNKTKNKKQKKPVKHPKLRKAIKIILIILFLLFVILVGIVAGMLSGIFGGDLALTEEDLQFEYENSVLLDMDGNVIAELSGEENRKIISKADMSPYLEKAFIAIEDKRYETHNGVDLARTAKATISFLLHKGESDAGGGSTITQQVVKNITDEDDDSGMQGAIRKIKEIARAYELEKLLSKDQILELYLNLIPLCGTQNIYGVETASEYYFNKSAKDLSLVESAYLAGITHSPSRYNPYVQDEEKLAKNMEEINKRVTKVVTAMKDQERITQEEYDAAIEEINNGIHFEKGNFSNSYTYLAEEAIKQVVKDLQEEYGWSEEIAKLHAYGSGYKIYTTQDTRIQEIVEEEFAKDKYIIYSGDDQVQAGMAIIQNGTGYVVGIAGALGEKTTFGLNRATTASGSPGSTIKPIAVIAPSLENGLITAGSVIDDSPGNFGRYDPRNWYEGKIGCFGYGLSNIRFMLQKSQNVPEVKLIQKLTPAKSIEFMRQLGVTSLDDTQDNNLSLALGGITYGISPLEMAAAYTVFSNGGTYVEPTFYIKVEDANGNVVLEPKQETRKVMSEGNAYIMTQLLREPIIGAEGTARPAFRRYTGAPQISGKTGTSQSDEASSFEGFSTYYSAYVLYKYDGKHVGVKDNAKEIWLDVMNRVYDGYEAQSFERPDSVTTASICKDSGLLAGELCSQDPRGNRVYSELFVKGTVPTETCTCHVKETICKESGLLANEYCTDTEEKVFISRENAEEDDRWQQTLDAKYMVPLDHCDIHTKSSDKEKPVITLKGDKTITIKLNEKFVDPGVTITDNVDKDLKAEITGKVDTSKVGTYTLTYKVKDKAGNEATATRTVVVTDGKTTEDKEKPVITLKGDKTITVKLNEKFVDPGVTITDNVDKDLKAEITGKVDTSKAGTYTLTYTVKDKAGNEASVTRTVIVEDNKTTGNNTENKDNTVSKNET